MVIVSITLLILSYILFWINALIFGAYNSFLAIAEPLCRLISFILAVIGIVKSLKKKNKKRIFLFLPGIIFPLLSLGIFIANAINLSGLHSTYTNEYVYDKDKNKIEYRLESGFLEYNRHDIFSWICYPGVEGQYFYTVYLSGLNGEPLPLPYCDWLNLDGDNPMIGLAGFCDYYHHYIEEDESNKRTIIYQLSDRLILPWGKYRAYYEKSGEEIILKYPVVHRNNGDGHINKDGSDTFVDTDLLYYAGFLKLYNEDVCNDFYEYLGTKWKVIEDNGDFVDGEYFYKGNQISGAAIFLRNNELLEDSVVKIGMCRDDVLKIFGPSRKTGHSNCLEYDLFELFYDENEIINVIYLCYD